MGLVYLHSTGKQKSSRSFSHTGPSGGMPRHSHAGLGFYCIIIG